MPHPRCTERIGSTDALSPHVAADPGAGTRCLRLLTEHTPEATPRHRSGPRLSHRAPTLELVNSLPKEISKFRVSVSAFVVARQASTYKDSTLTVTKQASELLLPVGLRWIVNDPTAKFSFPKGTETSSFFFSFLITVLV